LINLLTTKFGLNEYVTVESGSRRSFGENGSRRIFFLLKMDFGVVTFSSFRRQEGLIANGASNVQRNVENKFE
jgi:hypothetical protein